MTTLVLTVIGDDRAGLVKALADVVDRHGGSWDRSHLAEAAGKFAGIVVVEVAAENAEALQADLAPLEGLLEVEVHTGTPAVGAPRREVSVEVVGNDRPGIVRAVSGALAEHGLSVTELRTSTREAPMAGGRLFEARATVMVPGDADLAALRQALEELATEIMVDLTLGDLEG